MNNDEREKENGAEMNQSLKAPFPYFGGKRRVAGEVWRALGDVGHFLEPFCGSCAVLLLRPGWRHDRHVETINDADGHIANVWRALQANPDEVAKWCDWPVNHCDLIARKKRLNLNTESLLENLCKDDTYYDPKLAGYYIWAASCWIGHGLIRPGQIPRLSAAGMGVHAKGQRAQLKSGDQGVHAKGKIPHLGHAGMGVHTKGQRASGATDDILDVRDVYNENIYAWFRQLSERLRDVRVVCGDWSRVCGGNWQNKPGRPCGIFFDPPYSDVADRNKGLYAVDSDTVAHDVRQWCKGRADDPNYRIVLAGYFDEHKELLDMGWTVHRWSAQGGYASIGKGETQGGANRHKEALFFSPHCLANERIQ
jgi:site-specific DNA-adenine methylase